MRPLLPVLLLLSLLLAACQQPAAPAASVASPTADLSGADRPAASPTAVPSVTSAPAPSATLPALPSATLPALPSATLPALPSATLPALPSATISVGEVGGVAVGGEAIWLREPGPGSRIVSPLRVAGDAASTFEQNLVVRLVTADGTELALQPTTIQAPLGQRGPWSVEIPFTVAQPEQAFVQIFATSPRDGGITHLSAVGVQLAPSGSAEIRPPLLNQEQITISQPAPGAQLRGGTVLVEGIALASFEQTLEVRLLDGDGNTLFRGSVIVNAPDLGQPGPYRIELPYSVSSTTPARVVVRDPSPAFNGTVHLASVEIVLEP